MNLEWVDDIIYRRMQTVSHTKSSLLSFKLGIYNTFYTVSGCSARAFVEASFASFSLTAAVKLYSITMSRERERIERYLKKAKQEGLACGCKEKARSQ